MSFMKSWLVATALAVTLAGPGVFAGEVMGDPRLVSPAAKIGSSFLSCDTCVEMARIPEGDFQMGSPPAETGHRDDEAPLHPVHVKTFWLGKYPITRGQFDLFVQDTGYEATGPCRSDEGRDNRSWRDPGFAQTDDHPVVCVSWDDAQAYVRWLSAKTGKVYRLPSEAEWEYAARAGTTTARYWGDIQDEPKAAWCHYAQVAECEGGYAQTAPVGGFPPNAFELYDMIGNVRERTEDCYHAFYRAAPADGAAWVTGGCETRTARGGSWYDPPMQLRAAARAADPTMLRDARVGFRVARTD
jgi:formylglycine-generating enzyme required for sulfatase activity